MRIRTRQRDDGEPRKARPANNDNVKDHQGGPRSQPDLSPILLDRKATGIKVRPDASNLYREGRDYTVESRVYPSPSASRLWLSARRARACLTAASSSGQDPRIGHRIERPAGAAWAAAGLPLGPWPEGDKRGANPGRTGHTGFSSKSAHAPPVVPSAARRYPNPVPSAGSPRHWGAQRGAGR